MEYLLDEKEHSATLKIIALFEHLEIDPYRQYVIFNYIIETYLKISEQFFKED